MNQTGLAQKFGPVVSHLRIADKQSDIHAVRIPAGDADLVIGADLLVAASDDSLAKMHLERTHAIVNDTITSTVEFVSNPDTVYNSEAMKHSIEQELSENRARFLPAGEIAEALLGDVIATNLFLVGFAYQQGLVPVSAKAINKALELNGVKVDFNQKAFYWGRRAFLNQSEVEKLAGMKADHLAQSESLEDIIEYRHEQLVAYQNASYAKRYLDIVSRVKAVEQSETGQNKFSIAVARSLYKLMAIKDEYEVGRLYTDGKFIEKIRKQFVGEPRFNFYLAPPTLDILFGKNSKNQDPHKKQFGHNTFVLLKVLARLKFLRGTVLDVFGYSQERKMERQLLADFIENVDLLLETLNQKNTDLAVDIVEAALKVRGFGQVKHRNYLDYQRKLNNMMTAYQTGRSNIHSIKVEVADVA